MYLKKKKIKNRIKSNKCTNNSQIFDFKQSGFHPNLMIKRLVCLLMPKLWG